MLGDDISSGGARKCMPQVGNESRLLENLLIYFQHILGAFMRDISFKYLSCNCYVGTQITRNYVIRSEHGSFFMHDPIVFIKKSNTAKFRYFNDKAARTRIIPSKWKNSRQ